MIEHIPEMIDAGIDSFKIEGRMKTACMWQQLRERTVRQLMIIWKIRRNMRQICRGIRIRFQIVPIVSSRQDFILENQVRKPDL